MRSIETLAKLNPDLTGKEILELHKKEISDLQLKRKEEILEKLKYITDDNKVSYFESLFGHDARYSKVWNARIDDDIIYADVEIISIDDKIQIPTHKDYSFNIEKQSYHQVEISSLYYYNFGKKISENDWNIISKYLKDVRDFYNYYKREE